METMSSRSLSVRGAQLAGESPMAPYIVEHFSRAGSRWHASDDPEGYVPLCIAQNSLTKELVLERLAQVPPPPARILGYDAMVGAQTFREQLAGFFERSIFGRRFAPEQLAVMAGAGTVLECVFYALADPGDAVLVPTPSYAGFWTDLETRDELQIVPVHSSREDGFRFDIARLDAALEASDRPVRAVLFTNPDNPRGSVAKPDEIEALLNWAEARELHVVFDEIYALSVFGETPFQSVAALRPSLGERVHIVWAFSKDFGASGLRVGVLASENEALLAAVQALAYWGAVSGHTQWLLGDLISDVAWVEGYLIELRTRLAARYERVTGALDAAGIAYVPAEAGIFLLCDVRRFLREPTWEAEQALWRRILDEANVNITPGSACRIQEPGFLRLCYASEPLEAVLAGIERVGRCLGPG